MEIKIRRKSKKIQKYDVQNLAETIKTYKERNLHLFI